MAKKTIITAAVTGAWPKKENNPNVPLQPEEIAETAVFLAKSKYITGQVIRVDGGMVIG